VSIVKLSIEPHREVVLFCIRLLGIAAVLIGVWTLLPARLLEPLTQWEARFMTAILRMLGFDPWTRGATVWTNRFSVIVVKECLAVDAALLLASFIAAYPAPLYHKVTGIVGGAAAMHAVNQIRLVGVFFTGAVSRRFFDYAHVYFGQAFILLAVLGIAGIWIRTVTGTRPADGQWRFLAAVSAYSLVGFALWIPLHPLYVAVLEAILNGLAFPFDIRFVFAEFAIHEGTFNLVPFLALVLATTSLDRRAKLRRAGAGVLVLALTHMLFKLMQIHIPAVTVRYADAVLIGLFRLGAIVLPVVLWAWVRSPRRRQFRCPLCGEWKVGIIDHIRAVHGADSLNDERVERVTAMAQAWRKHSSIAPDTTHRHGKRR
jgi:exosortase H (IPTLxxWG-CTERM-specific)